MWKWAKVGRGDGALSRKGLVVGEDSGMEVCGKPTTDGLSGGCNPIRTTDDTRAMSTSGGYPGRGGQSYKLTGGVQDLEPSAQKLLHHGHTSPFLIINPSPA